MSCTVLLARKWEQALAPGAAREFEVDFDLSLARRWESRTWSQGDVIRGGAYDAECEEGGRSGQFEPEWPETLDEPVQDGSASWKIVAPSSASLVTTATGFEWTAPTGITASAGQDTTTGTVRKLTVAADVAPGEYEVMVTATCVNGDVIKQPCILQVA